MCHESNEKQKKTNNGKNRITKLRKSQNAWRKENLHFGISEADIIKLVEMKEKIRKEMNEKISWNQAL